MNLLGLPNLGEIKKDIISGKDDALEEFVLEVANAIDNHLWCYFPTMPNSNNVALVRYLGKPMIAAYSSAESKKIAPDMICTDINKIIDILYSNKDLCGIVFDLDDNPIVIQRDWINEISNRKDPRLKKRDWGTGIPKYTSEDIITKDELFDFGMKVAEEEIEKEGYSIIQTVHNYRFIVSIVATKNEKKYYFYVKTTVLPEASQMDSDEEKHLKEVCKEEKALPLFIPVEFGSTDKERFDASLLLAGDEFYYRYTGIITLDNIRY